MLWTNGVRLLTCLSSIDEVFPGRELDVRRLYGRDEEFRFACEDYDVAVKALRYWEQVEENPVRAAEYRRLTHELAAEVKARLDTAFARAAMKGRTWEDT